MTILTVTSNVLLHNVASESESSGLSGDEIGPNIVVSRPTQQATGQPQTPPRPDLPAGLGLLQTDSLGLSPISSPQVHVGLPQTPPSPRPDLPAGQGLPQTGSLGLSPILFIKQ